MTRTVRIVVTALALALAAESAVLALVAWRGAKRTAAEGSPVVRGRQVAERMGCFGCHGPGGARPVANPGARGGEVPAWTGGTWMMFNRDEADVRSWIIDGRPRDRKPDPGALIAMPAYGGRLGPREIDDVVAYVLAVSTFGTPTEPRAAEGRDIALRFGCFGCHGPEGRGLVANPGSLTGYVPAWDGADFDDLVRDREEFQAWVLDGVPPRLRGNPVARSFLTRQALKMPAYRERIDAAGVDALYAFARFARENPRTGRTP